MEDVQVWHQRWHSLHPETKRWQMACQRQAYEHKRIGVQILSHRKRHFPGGIDKKNAPANHTIQGFAAEIANRGLLRLVEAIPHRGWTPVSGVFLQVHDYIGAYVPRERMWEAKHIVEEALQYEYEGMKFTCTAEASYRWSDQG
jgi:DNA polymerase I-like protein with 3'-5' exonuclease and polymerase domains